MSAKYRCRTASYIHWSYGPWLLEFLSFPLQENWHVCSIELRDVCDRAHLLPKTWFENYDRLTSRNRGWATFRPLLAGFSELKPKLRQS